MVEATSATGIAVEAIRQAPVLAIVLGTLVYTVRTMLGAIERMRVGQAEEQRAAREESERKLTEMVDRNREVIADNTQVIRKFLERS